VGYSDGEHGKLGVGYRITAGFDGQYANSGYN